MLALFTPELPDPAASFAAPPVMANHGPAVSGAPRGRVRAAGYFLPVRPGFGPHRAVRGINGIDEIGPLVRPAFGSHRMIT